MSPHLRVNSLHSHTRCELFLFCWEHYNVIYVITPLVNHKMFRDVAINTTTIKGYDIVFERVCSQLYNYLVTLSAIFHLGRFNLNYENIKLLRYMNSL